MNPEDKQQIIESARNMEVLIKCRRLVSDGKPADAVVQYRARFGGSPWAAMAAIGIKTERRLAISC